MAVPKKKSANIKYKYSIKKKEYLKKIKNGKILCKNCNIEIKKDIQNLIYCWKTKICINCIKIIKNKKKIENKKEIKNEE